MDTVDRMTLDELHAQMIGTGYVADLVAEDDGSRLTVVYPERRVEVVVAELPDAAEYRRPDALRTVLAVQVRNGAGAPECSVLGSSPDGGPVRVPITLAQALRAAASGIRTVVVHD